MEIALTFPCLSRTPGPLLHHGWPCIAGGVLRALIQTVLAMRTTPIFQSRLSADSSSQYTGLLISEMVNTDRSVISANRPGTSLYESYVAECCFTENIRSRVANGIA